MRAPFLDEAAAARHELWHDKFLRETSIGGLQVVLKQVAEWKAQSLRASQASNWLSLLMESSHATHERGATYCTIKSYSASREGDLLCQLPATYRGYFDDVARVVESVFHSSYLQILVGNVLVEMALSCPLKRLIAEFRLDEPRLDDLERPDLRFSLLSKCFGLTVMSGLATHVQHYLKKSAADLGLPSDFDPQVETHWENLPFGVACEADASDERVIRSWMYAYVAGKLPVLERPWRQEMQRFCDRLGAQVGKAIQVYEPPAGDEDLGSRARRAMRMFISNVPEVVSRDIPRVRWASWRVHALPGEKRVINASCAGSPARGEWLVFGDGEGRHPPLLRISLSALRGWMWWLKRRGIWQSRRDMGLRRLIVGMQSPEEFPLYHAMLRPRPAEGTLMLRAATDRLVWYMHGDLWPWLQSLLGCGDFQHMEVAIVNTDRYRGWSRRREKEFNPESTAGAVVAGFAATPSLVCHMFRHHTLPGVFMRWFPWEASIVVGSYLETCAFSPLDEKQRSWMSDVATSTLGPIFSSWREV